MDLGDQGKYIGLGDQGKYIGLGDQGKYIGLDDQGKYIGLGNQGKYIGLGDQGKYILSELNSQVKQLVKTQQQDFEISVYANGPYQLSETHASLRKDRPI